MDLRRALNRTLWMEALYDAFPCRFTLWLWARAGNKLRAIRDSAIVKARVSRPDKFSVSRFVDSLTGAAKARQSSRAATQAFRMLGDRPLPESAMRRSPRSPTMRTHREKEN